MMKLKFGKANSKLVKLEKTLQTKVITFSLPSGFTCPGALDCLSKANRQTGKITDGAHTKFRCFHASMESLYPALRKMVWHNFELIKACGNDSKLIAQLIHSSLPTFFNVCRIHIGGDFFNQAYFNAWIAVAKNNPSKLFYAYTKSINFRVAKINDIPANLVFTASRGGKFDYMINQYGLKCAEVVFTELDASEKGLEIDHDDSHAAVGTKSFALLIHGTQPKGSVAAKARSVLNK